MSTYPHTLGDLHRYAPVDGEVVRADDFNALHQEVTVVEAVLGRAVQGAAASLVARLAVSMNGDGSFKREFLCEDGEEGQGSRRYLCTRAGDNVAPGNYADADLPEALFAEDPIVLLGSWNDRTGSGTYTAQGVFVVNDLSPSGIRAWHNRQLLGPSGNNYLVVLAISQLQSFPDDVPYAAPPWRQGATILGPPGV